MKKNLALSTILLIIVFSTSAFAQSTAKEDEIPSDLSLDLQLGIQNPAPEQKQIVEAQVTQAQEIGTSNNGEFNNGQINNVDVRDSVPEEIKVESKKDAENPEQTTSEQVQQVTVQEQQNNQGQPEPSASPENQPTEQPQGSPSSDNIDTTASPSDNSGGATPASNFIPGTTVTEPDDNAAPPTPEPQSSPVEVQPTPQPQSNSSTESQPSAENPTPTSVEGTVQGAKVGPVLSVWQRVLSLFSRI